SFTPRQLEATRDRVQRTVDALLDRVVARGAVDFIRELAFPLPAMIIAGLMGAPEEDLEPIKTWSDRLASYLGGAVDERDNFEEASAGVAALVDYFHALLRERERRPRDDLMSLMLRAEHEGEHLTRDEVVANCVLLLFAGHETTTNLLGNGLYHLLRHPAQAALLRADPSLLHSAVEELLRYDGPVPATVKIATEDVPWCGRTIRRGDMVVPFIASANRDPRQFPDPDTLDVRRQPERHLAFAWGIHFCLGAWLARLEARVVLDTVLRRLPHLALAPGAPRWKPMLFLRGRGDDAPPGRPAPSREGRRADRAVRASERLRRAHVGTRERARPDPSRRPARPGGADRLRRDDRPRRRLQHGAGAGRTDRGGPRLRRPRTFPRPGPSDPGPRA